MKKILSIFAAVTLMFSMAACTNNKNKEDGAVKQGAAVVDENGEEIKGTTIDGATDEVDMDKVGGDALKGQENTTEALKNDIAGFGVEIGDAKVIEHNEKKLVILSFKVKNKMDKPAPFQNSVSIDVTQEQATLYAPLGNLPTGIDGINLNSFFEEIDPGETVTVQTAYTLLDDETPVNVMVYKYAEPTGESVYKTFAIK